MQLQWNCKADAKLWIDCNKSGIVLHDAQAVYIVHIIFQCYAYMIMSETAVVDLPSV